MKLAVIKTGGKQYKIKEKDTLNIEKLNIEEGKEVVFTDVLLVSDDNGENIQLGNPVVEGASVKAKVLEQGRSKKEIAFKYKPKVRYRKKIGHRQLFTKVEIISIETK